MNLNTLLQPLFALAMTLIPILGSGAQNTVERAVTIPERDIREKYCQGMSEDDIQIVIAKFRQGADCFSDAICMAASKGKVRPD